MLFSLGPFYRQSSHQPTLTLDPTDLHGLITSITTMFIFCLFLLLKANALKDWWWSLHQHLAGLCRMVFTGCTHHYSEVSRTALICPSKQMTKGRPHGQEMWSEDFIMSVSTLYPPNYHTFRVNEVILKLECLLPIPKVK